jgi:hypothetical protein
MTLLMRICGIIALTGWVLSTSAADPVAPDAAVPAVTPTAIATSRQVETLPTHVPVASDEAPITLLRAAIFVQNKAASIHDDRVEAFNDMVSTRLTEKGFSIIDHKEVVSKFREAVRTGKATEEQDKREAKAEKKKSDEEQRRYRQRVQEIKLMRMMSAGKGDMPAPIDTDAGGTVADEPTPDIGSLLDNTSALRISQMIGADYLIFASITSVGTTTANFNGKNTSYGVDMEVATTTLRVALKVNEGNEGGSVYGDPVTVSERIPKTATYSSTSDDTINKLLDVAAQKIADNITDKVERIRTVKVKTTPMVEFTVNCNLENANVLLDGVAIGSTPGRFMARPGIHNMSLTREWCKPWQNVVNLQAGKVLSVQLELSATGVERYKDLESFKQNLALEKKEREIKADGEKAKADGIKTFLENSAIKVNIGGK